MPLTIIGDTDRNALVLDADLASALTGSATFLGTGSRLVVEAPFSAHGLSILLGGGACARIAAGCIAGQLEIHAPAGGAVAIGAGCAFNGLVRLLVHEPRRIEIGRDCLFGADVVVTVSDMHAIFDAGTGERLNGARDVAIGDRVWIGYRSFIGKGSRIGAGSVIGAHAFVTGAIASNTLAAGQPARPLRDNIRWSRELS